MNLTEAEDIKKRWQEYIEELYKKDLMTQITQWCNHLPRVRHPGVQSQVGLRKQHLKLAEGMEFQPSYFKSSKVVL